MERMYSQRATNKPRGLWYGVDHDWRCWCEQEMPHWMEGVADLVVNIHADANILTLSNVRDLITFTKEYTVREERPGVVWQINWPTIAEKYDGIEIAPYMWEARMKEGTFWYYAWDCASGCIWNLKAIKSITLP